MQLFSGKFWNVIQFQYGLHTCINPSRDILQPNFRFFEIFKENNDRNAIFDYYAGIKVAVISEK